MNDHGAAGALRGPGVAAPEVVASRSATLSMWLGILGFALGFLLLFTVLTPAAIVCGIRALREIRDVPQLRGRGRALTGIALAIVAPVVWVGLFVGLLADGVL